MTHEEFLYEGYGDMWQRCMAMVSMIPAEADAIAGVPVSGLAPAGMLSAASGVRCVSIDAIPDDCQVLLVLEDASGFAKAQAASAGTGNKRTVIYGAVYACDAALASLDIVGCVAEKYRVFTWNLLKHTQVYKFATDLDGVLCRNPRHEEIDYAQHYDAFIETAAQLRVVKSQIGWIVTGRMERYRQQTENWLAAKGIKYGELVMAPNGQGYNCGAYAKRKADWYAESDAVMFIESSEAQAKLIHDQTRKPVICATTERSFGMRRPEDIATLTPVRIKRNDKLIYTISTGEYTDFAPKGYQPPLGWDYYIVTDSDCPAYLSPKQKAAWAKINAPRIFEEYKVTLCVDDDMTVLKDPTPLYEGVEMATLCRDNASTWHKDLALCVSVRCACTQDQARRETERLARAGFGDSQNWLSGIIWRKHTAAVKRLCDEWWFWYAQSETQRDQPSLAVACAKLNYEPAAFTEQSLKEYIKHDSRKADTDRVRQRIEEPKEPDEQPETSEPKQVRRRGDR